MKFKHGFLTLGIIATIICLVSSAVNVNANPISNIFNKDEGGMHPKQQIDFVKKQIKKGVQPYSQAYSQLILKASEALNAQDHAIANFAVPGFYDNPEEHVKNSQSLQTDAFNAYACALAYALGKEEKYAVKAAQILKSWSTVNKTYSEHDGALVMAYSGSGLVIAGDLIKGYKGWSVGDKAQFDVWVRYVYKKACDQIRNHTNNWADWGRFGSILSADYLNDEAEIAENIRLIKSDLFNKIAEDGSMPEETRREENGLWYTYFSLTPITAACWIAYNRTGENLFVLEQDGKSIKKALDYLFYYNQHPDEWKWFENPKQGTPDSNYPTEGVFWPGDLMEAMGAFYDDSKFIEYVTPHRPIIYGAHHYAWTFPTLMPVWTKERFDENKTLF